jgi:hypothetical protein
MWIVLVSFAVFGAFGQAQQSSTRTATKLSDLPAADKLLQIPDRNVVYDSVPFSPGSIIPHWDNGFLISRDVQIGGPSHSAVRLYDLSGAKSNDISVWFNGAASVNVGSALMLPKGGLLLSGSAQKADGTWGTFIAWIDKTGRMTNVVQTMPFRAQYVCAAPDGTAWAFGDTGETGASSDSMLRRFDPIKGQTESMLPRSTFKTPGRFSPAFYGGDGMRVYLRCSKDRLSIYTETANEYLEMDFNSLRIRRWQLDLSAFPFSAEGFALTQSGDVFTGSPVYSQHFGHRAVFQLQKDDEAQTARWLRVAVIGEESVDQCPVRTLLGADGDSLVYLKADAIPKVAWAKTVDRNAAQATVR